MGVPKGLDALIAALQIFRKYGNPGWPTHCEHDIMVICDIAPKDVSEEDKAELEQLGFQVGTPDAAGEESFYSYRFGSA